MIIEMGFDMPTGSRATFSRPNGYPGYTFLFADAPAEVLIGGETVRTQPNFCIFVSPGVQQHFFHPYETIHSWFHTPQQPMETLLKQFQIPCDTLLYPKDTVFIFDAVRKMKYEFYSDHSFKEDMLEACMRQLLIGFSRQLQNAEQPVPVSREEEQKLRALRMQVLSQPERHWTVAQMAELVCLCPSWFHVVYKAVFHASPMQELIEARINRARNILLSETNEKVSAVAERVGYSNPYHFIRQFKSITGETPGEFRKKHL